LDDLKHEFARAEDMHNLKSLEQDVELAKLGDIESARRREIEIRKEIEDEERRRERERADFRHHMDMEEEKKAKARTNAVADAKAGAEIAAVGLETEIARDKAENEALRDRMAMAQEMADAEARRSIEAAKEKGLQDRQMAELEKDMTSDQLLARALKEGPEAAQAVAQILTAKAQAQGGEQQAATQAALYQQMIQLLQDQSKQGLDAVKEVAVAQAQKPDEFRDMHKESMKHLSNIAVAQARGPDRSSATPSTPSPFPPQTWSAGPGRQPSQFRQAQPPPPAPASTTSTAAGRRCPKCSAGIDEADARFCSECSHKLA
jgi:hypothetical protein